VLVNQLKGVFEGVLQTTGVFQHMSNNKNKRPEKSLVSTKNDSMTCAIIAVLFIILSRQLMLCSDQAWRLHTSSRSLTAPAISCSPHADHARLPAFSLTLPSVNDTTFWK
jgi:hypothetical protein